jgi:adenosylcobinamide-phosphate synthase
MAGGLGVRLGGEARYDGVATARPTFGDGPPPTVQHLADGLALYRRACGLFWSIPLLIGLAMALAR